MLGDPCQKTPAWGKALPCAAMLAACLLTQDLKLGTCGKIAEKQNVCEPCSTYVWFEMGLLAATAPFGSRIIRLTAL